MAEQDKELQTVHAPYNFIEFPRQILEDRADNVDHSCLDASRRTGEIKITLTAETPVFVSDGNKDDPHFFRAPGGNYALPGSTVRGMVRKICRSSALPQYVRVRILRIFKYISDRWQGKTTTLLAD